MILVHYCRVAVAFHQISKLWWIRLKWRLRKNMDGVVISTHVANLGCLMYTHLFWRNNLWTNTFISGKNCSTRLPFSKASLATFVSIYTWTELIILCRPLSSKCNISLIINLIVNQPGYLWSTTLNLGAMVRALSLQNPIRTTAAGCMVV